MSIVTCIAPAHVTVLNNCGMVNGSSNLPYNDSISLSLDMDVMCAKTMVVASDEFKDYKIIINGRDETVGNTELRHLFEMVKEKSDSSAIKRFSLLKIYGENNIYKEAGLDSKAAEHAALLTALCHIYEVNINPREIYKVGYGPTCRSLYGGFVKWYKLTNESGLAISGVKPIIDAKHWPELRVMILVVRPVRARVLTDTPGTSQSEYLRYRASTVVPARSNDMWEAIYYKDFRWFVELTMKDSDEMQAGLFTTYPPVIYLNDVSHRIIDLVHAYNHASDHVKVGYTFENNPSAILFLKDKYLQEFCGVLDYFFPPPPDKPASEYRKGMPNESMPPSEELLMKMKYPKQLPGKIEYIIHTRLGEGPKMVSDL